MALVDVERQLDARGRARLVPYEIGDRKLGSGVGWNPHVVAGNPDRRAFD